MEFDDFPDDLRRRLRELLVDGEARQISSRRSLVELTERLVSDLGLGHLLAIYLQRHFAVSSLAQLCDKDVPAVFSFVAQVESLAQTRRVLHAAPEKVH